MSDSPPATPSPTTAPPVEWSSRDGRISLHIEVEPGEPRAGEPVIAVIKARYAGAGGESGKKATFNYSLTVEGIDAESNGIADCALPLATPEEVAPFERTWEWSGRYERDGSYRVVADLTPRCIDDDSQLHFEETLVVRS